MLIIGVMMQCLPSEIYTIHLYLSFRECFFFFWGGGVSCFYCLENMSSFFLALALARLLMIFHVSTFSVNCKGFKNSNLT